MIRYLSGAVLTGFLILGCAGFSSAADLESSSSARRAAPPFFLPFGAGGRAPEDVCPPAEAPKGSRTAGARMKNGVLRFLTLKGPDAAEAEHRALQHTNLERAEQRLPPLDRSGNTVEGWDKENVKMSPRNIWRHAHGLPPVK